VKLFASISLLLLIAAAHVAQTPTARKFDEFGDAELSDIAARLDNFAIELRNEPNMKGFVIAYRSHRDLPGVSSGLVEWSRNYLVIHGLPSDRIIAIDGGAANCVSQEFWLAPPGTTPAIRADAYPRTFEYEGLQQFSEAIYAESGWESESYSFDISNSFEGFAEALRRHPKTVGYLIAYAGVRKDERGQYNDKGIEIWHKTVTIVQPAASARRELRNRKSYLVKKFGVSSSRLITIFGGYREAPIMELWIGPHSGHAPIATPTIFLRKRR
jgi:hypothetical protein